MKASIGRIIITLGVLNSNGTDEHPAIITRAWSDKDTADGPVCVNATVLPDCGPPQSQGSIQVYDNRALAEAEQEHNNAIGKNRESFNGRGLSGPMVAFWPERL